MLRHHRAVSEDSKEANVVSAVAAAAASPPADDVDPSSPQADRVSTSSVLEQRIEDVKKELAQLEIDWLGGQGVVYR